MSELKYLTAYPDPLRQQAATLVKEGRLGALLRSRYPTAHGLRTDRALYGYVQDLKDDYLRNADPVAKVAYDSKIHVVQHALGLHTSISRVQGGRLKAKHEIRIASVFRDAPLEFLRMIAVHELVRASKQVVCNMRKSVQMDRRSAVKSSPAFGKIYKLAKRGESKGLRDRCGQSAGKRLATDFRCQRFARTSRRAVHSRSNALFLPLSFFCNQTALALPFHRVHVACSSWHRV